MNYDQLLVQTYSILSLKTTPRNYTKLRSIVALRNFQNSNSNSNQPLHPTQKIADQSWDPPQSAQKMCKNTPKPWEWLEPNLQKPHAHHQSNITHPNPQNSPHTTRWPWSAVLLTWRRHFKFKITDALIHLNTHTHAVAATLASFSYSNNMTDQLPNCKKKEHCSATL